MSTDEKILQALTEQGKLLTALHADMTTVKRVQQEQGICLALSVIVSEAVIRGDF